MVKKIIKRKPETVVRKNIKTRDIGIDVTPPARLCADDNCPFHGDLPVRGVMIEGTVLSAKMNRSVVVAKEYSHFIKKYERYEKRTRKYLAHAPPCMDVSPGTHVKIMECRPLSKEISFVVVEAKE